MMRQIRVMAGTTILTTLLSGAAMASSSEPKAPKEKSTTERNLTEREKQKMEQTGYNWKESRNNDDSKWTNSSWDWLASFSFWTAASTQQQHEVVRSANLHQQTASTQNQDSYKTQWDGSFSWKLWEHPFWKRFDRPGEED